jgi:hypothetical protein
VKPVVDENGDLVRFEFVFTERILELPLQNPMAYAVLIVEGSGVDGAKTSEELAPPICSTSMVFRLDRWQAVIVPMLSHRRGKEGILL